MEQILLSRALLLVGLPEDYLRSLCYVVSPDSPFYVRNQFPQNPQLFFSDELLAKFSSDDPNQRFQAGLKLGRPLNQINLNLAADIVDVPSNIRAHTRVLMKDYLDHILLRKMKVKFAGRVDPRKIDDASDMIKSLMDDETLMEQPRFVAIGGTIRLILPGQELITSEYQMGTEFHTDTYCYISYLALRRFLDYTVIYNRGFMEANFPSQVMERASKVKPVLAMLGLGDREATADCFLHSELQFRYMQSDHPKINPYKALA